jgi:hypothetical protein
MYLYVTPLRGKDLRDRQNYCQLSSTLTWSIRGMTEIPRFAWFATINKGVSSVRHSGESDAIQICMATVLF